MHFFGVSGSGPMVRHGASKELFPLMNHVSDPGSLIMIQITPKEHTVSVIIIDFRNSKQKHTSKTRELNVQRSL